MPKKTVKRCVRPQCMEIYDETEKNRFCACGALLQITEIDIKPKKNTYKKPVNVTKPKTNPMPIKEEEATQTSNDEDVKVVNEDESNDEIYVLTNSLGQNSANENVTEESDDDETFDFFGTNEDGELNEDSVEEDEPVGDTKAFLYLLLDDDDVEFELSNITRIGRAADGVQVDIDLSEYAGKDVSREHAVIRKEKDGYYITNVSRNHSVRLMDQEYNEVALEYGKRALLKTGDGIILSKKILLQFEEEE